MACNPGPCPDLGIEPATFWFVGRHSVHCATPARAIYFLMTAIFKYIFMFFILSLQTHLIDFRFLLFYRVKQLLGIISSHSLSYIFLWQRDGVQRYDLCVFHAFPLSLVVVFPLLLVLVCLNSCHTCHACVAWVRFSVRDDIMRTFWPFPHVIWQ